MAFATLGRFQKQLHLGPFIFQRLESGLEQRVHLLLAVQLDPVLVAQLWKERELFLWGLERFEAPLQRGANGAGAGDYQALHQAH